MSSLADCIKRHVPKGQRADFAGMLREKQQGHIDDKIPGKEAREQAVRDVLAELREERADIVRQITAAKEKSAQLTEIGNEETIPESGTNKEEDKPPSSATLTGKRKHHPPSQEQGGNAQQESEKSEDKQAAELGGKIPPNSPSTQPAAKEEKKAQARIAATSTITGRKPVADQGPANQGQKQGVPVKGTFAPAAGRIAAGAFVTADTESGRTVNLRYAVVEASDLVTSHDDSLAVNSGYPARLQPRERSRDAYRMQVEKIAKEPRAAWLGANPKVSEGAPVVSLDLVVLSGNGRTIGLRQAYGGQTAGEYRQWLLDNAGQFGIQAKDLKQIKQPVLVRKLVDMLDMDELAELAMEANNSGVSSMSQFEQAMVDAERLATLDDFAASENGAIDTAANQSFIRRFIAGMPQGEQNTMMDGDGKLSQSGTARIRNAVFALAFPNQQIVARVVESTDNNIRNITNGMLQAAPAIASMRLAISRGELYNLDITQHLTNAVEDFARIRANGMAVDAALAQGNLFGDPRTDLAKRLLRFFDQASRSGKKINDFLQAYVRRVRAAGNPKQLNLFGQKKEPASMELVETAIGLATGNLHEQAQQSLFGIRSDRPDNQDTGDGGDSGGSTGRGGERPGATDRQGAADYGSENKIFTAAAAARARERLKQKLARLHSGLDPELLADAIQVAGYHVEAGARKFADFVRAMVADLGKAIQPFLPGLYENIRRYPGFNNAGMSATEEVDSYVPGTDGDMERDSQHAAAGDGVGHADVFPAVHGAAAGRGERGNGADGARPAQQGDHGVSGGGAAAAGKPGDQQLPRQARKDGSAAGPAGGEQPQRGGPADEHGAPHEQGGNGTVAHHAAGALAEHEQGVNKELADRRREQKRANSKPVSFYSIENIRESLPFLFPEQQDDVLKAEKRFFSAKGRGMMFTNGTGTGKTYTGLGIARRFFSAGKNNILIVVPKQTKLQDWIADGANLGLSIRPLADTRDSGPGLLITTYANFYQNEALQARYHDLIIYDECHFISAGKDGDQTASFIEAHRVAADHPGYLVDKEKLADKKWLDLLARVEARAAELVARKDFHPRMEEEARKKQARYAAWNEMSDERIIVERWLEQKALDRKDEFSKVVFLSATPFAHHKSLLYADKYLFDVDEGRPANQSRGYNDGDNADQWFMTNLGYRMRYNKLTMPESGVDVGLLERNLHQKMVAAGSVSGRKLSVPFDYSREFVLLDSEMGRQIDEGMDIVRGWRDRENEYSYLPEIARRRYDYHYTNRLLETLKAREAVERIKKHLALGRKVVVFHDYIEGHPGHPFDFSSVPKSSEAGEEVARFNAKYPQYASLDLRGLKPVIQTMLDAFGDRAVFYNGRVPDRQRSENIRRFNTDDSGADVIVVLRAAGKEGDSLHDVTGKRPRVFLDLGLPYSPPAAIQGEGRIYRVGQQSDAIIEYAVLHTSFEQTAYGTKINTRVRTVENLAMGDAARDLDTAFREGYLNATEDGPGTDQGKGGKERDGNFEGMNDFARAKTYYYARGKKSQRQKSREGNDYYATPEPVGMKMTEWARPRAGESWLEPSAGHGAIARFFPADTVNHFVEPSGVLAGQLAVNTSGLHREGSFEELDLHNKYDVIVMNPPFGSGGATAVAHLEKAVKHLRDGGRIVALLPEGPAADKRLDKFYEDVKGVYRRGSVSLPAATFERAATRVKTRILVFDKVLDPDQAALLGDQNDYDLSGAGTVEELFDRIEHLEMPARLPASAAARQTGASPALPTSGRASAVTVTMDWHKQKNKEIFTAAWDQRLDRETYQKVAAVAKKHKGYWSRFAGKMVFEGSRDDAEAFAAEATPLLDSASESGVMFQREETAGREKYGPGRETEESRALEGAYRAQLEAAFGGDAGLERGAITDVSVSGPEAEAARELAKEFGRRVVFIHNKRQDLLPYGGAVIPDAPGVIYINANAAKPYLLVLGHELTHRMELDAPHLYERFRDAVMPMVMAGAWRRYQNNLHAMQAPGETPFSYDQMVSEMLANFMGENFMDKEFWQQVAGREPSLFVRIVNWIKNFLDQALAIFKKNKTLADTMFADVQQARAAAAEALADFMRQPVPAAGQSVDVNTQQPRPFFFSQLQRHLAAKLPGSGSPSSYFSTINSWVKQGQVKAEELRWSGLQEWLAGQDQDSRISRDELLTWLAENNLQVDEVTPGEVDEDTGASPFRQQTPGGGNYRELLLTLPDELSESQPIARVRCNERKDADGKRLLFIDEVRGEDKWALAAMKRMIRWAAEHGFDRVAWSPREQQTGRDEQKGMASSFYDEILPSAVNRYVKKWGTKVSKGKLRLRDNHTEEILDMVIPPAMRDDAMSGFPLFMREQVENTPDAVARDMEQDRTFLNRLFAQHDLGQHLASVKTAALQKELQGLAGPSSRRRHVLGFAYSKLKRSADSDQLDMALMVWRDVQSAPEKVEEFRDWARARLPKATGEEKIRIKEQLAVLERMDRMTPAQLAFADRIGELFDQAGAVAQANKVIGGFRDNYVRRLWNLPVDRQREFFAGAGSGFKVFSTAKMHRKFDTILDGWMNGYDLNVKGLTSSYGVYLAELEEILANKDFVRLGYATHDLAGRRLFSTSRTGEYKDYVELDASGFAVWEWAGETEAEKGPSDDQVLFIDSRGRRFFYSQVRSVPELWAVHRLDASGRPAKRAQRLFGHPDAAIAYANSRDYQTTVQHRPAKDVADAWEKRKLYAPPQLAAMINRATRKDRLFSGTPGLQELLRVSAALKSWILLSSFFHHIAGSRSWAFGVDHGWRTTTLTDPDTGEKLRTAGVNPVAAYKAGVKKIENLHPIIMRGVKNGLTLGNMQDWDESALRQNLGYARGLARRLNLQTLDNAMGKGSRLRQGMADSLFKRYFAGLKAEAFTLEYVHELQRAKERHEHGNGPAPDVDKIAERVARLINEDFGGLHLQRMGRHPTMQKILRLLLLAPDWCVDEKTRAMTKDGWKYYHELTGTDEIMAFDPATHTLKWSKLKDKYVNQHYSGKMVRVNNFNRCVLMTPEHTCYVRNFTTGAYDVVKAKDLQTNHLIPRCAPFPPPEQEIFTDKFVQTVGWMVTDGHFKPVTWTRKDGSKGLALVGKIKQAKPHTVKILKEMGFTCYVDKHNCDHDNFVARHPSYVFSVPAATVVKMKDAGIKDNNLSWEFLCKLTARQRQLLYDTLMLGDGTGQKRFCGKEKEVFMMTLLQTMMGLPSTFYQQEKNCWRTRWITRGKDISCWGHHNNKSEVEYSGTIWCPSVDTGFWMAEREGLMFITGNTESNFRMVSGLVPGVNEWISKMVGDLQPTAGMRPLYNRFFAKVGLRIAASTFLLQILLNGWDDSEEFWKEQLSGENFYKFRWLYADISKIYQALGIDLEGKRKVFPMGGHFFDPLKLFDPPRLIKGKGSPLMRAGEALMGGTDWAERPFTGTAEFLTTGKTIKDSRYAEKEGSYDRLPATIVNQIINMQPVQVGYFLKWLQGEEDTLSAMLLSAGVGVHNAWSPRVTGPIATGDDPVSAEIERLTKEDLLHMGPPSSTVTIGGVPQKLDREAYADYVRRSSERVKAKLLPLVQSERWGKITPEQQAEIIHDVITSSRKKVRGSIKRRTIRAAIGKEG